VRRSTLYERFLKSQQFWQDDPWAERAEGRDAEEFTPLARLAVLEAAE
jgi:nitrite reductase (NADH) large subunit